MKTDSKIAIGISSILVAIAIFLFIWSLPLIYSWIALSSPFSNSEQNNKKHTQSEYFKKAVKYSVFKWQKIYTIENLIPTLLLSNEYNEVIKYYEQMEKANIETNIAKSLSTFAYIKVGKYDKALQLAKETNNLYQQAKIYIATNNLDMAKKTVEEIFSTKTKSKLPYLYVAQIQLKEGYPKSANTSIDKLLLVNPQHTEALETKAEILKALGLTNEYNKYVRKIEKLKKERKIKRK